MKAKVIREVSWDNAVMDNWQLVVDGELIAKTTSYRTKMLFNRIADELNGDDNDKR